MRSIATAICVGLLLTSAPAAAHHMPKQYCSESGDVCISAKKEDGERILRISLAAKYFDEYKLCVTPPEAEKTCEKFNIEKSGKVFGDAVNWVEEFPDGGPGDYKVVWKQGGNKLGKTLGFHQ